MTCSLQQMRYPPAISVSIVPGSEHLIFVPCRKRERTWEIALPFLPLSNSSVRLHQALTYCGQSQEVFERNNSARTLGGKGTSATRSDRSGCKVKCAGSIAWEWRVECWVVDVVDAEFGLVHPRNFLLARYSHFRNISPNLAPRANLTGDITTHSRCSSLYSQPSHYPFVWLTPNSPQQTIGPSSKYPLREH